MKRILIALALGLLLSLSAFGADLKSVGKTDDAAITSGPGYLKGIVVHTDGTNAVTVAVYDNASAASGSKLISTVTVTTSASNRVSTISFEGHECAYSNGIYVDVTTSGTVTYDVYFESK